MGLRGSLMMGYARRSAWAAAFALIGWLGIVPDAPAADLYYAKPAATPWSPDLDPGTQFEARFGVFAHGIGSAERNTVSLNGEFVTPRMFNATGSWWSSLVPRLHAGGFINVQGRTDSAYVGLLWTFPIYRGFFAEGYLGGAIHNGSLAPTATMAGLGCPLLFSVGGSVGYRFNEHWSLMYTFNHLSNGRGVFSINCGTNQIPGGNQGLNNHGVRIGYAF